MSAPALGSNASRSLFLVLLVVGVVVLTLGVLACDSISSDFSLFFTGRPTDKSLWLLVAGVATTAIGLIGLARGPR